MCACSLLEVRKEREGRKTLSKNLSFIAMTFERIQNIGGKE
jgi:hypothetical protein